MTQQLDRYSLPGPYQLYLQEKQRKRQRYLEDQMKIQYYRNIDSIKRIEKRRIAREEEVKRYREDERKLRERKERRQKRDRNIESESNEDIHAPHCWCDICSSKFE